MKKIKKALLIVAGFILCLPLALFTTGCSRNSPEIVVTVFPIYDWTRVVLGDNPAGFTVRYLLDDGTDLHVYNASFQDRADIADCYLFIYVGGKSDGWTLNALAPQNQRNSDRRELRLMGLLALEETMQFPSENVPEIGSDECCGGALHDEHIWLSLRFAIRFVNAIRDEIIKLDPANAALYNANADAYIAELQALDNQFIEMMENAARDTIVVTDRFSFLYLVNDYEINFYAAFDGCSAATDVPAARRDELIRIVNDLNVQTILTVNNRALANTIATGANGNPEILYLEDFQTISRNRINNGFTFLNGMKTNLESLSAALA